MIKYYGKTRWFVFKHFIIVSGIKPILSVIVVLLISRFTNINDRSTLGFVMIFYEL